MGEPENRRTNEKINKGEGNAKEEKGSVRDNCRKGAINGSVYQHLNSGDK